MKQVRRHVTYANLMSSLAVFLVLGGATALAATQLAKNSVGTKQLKKNAVSTGKIRANAVTGAKAKESTFGQVPSAAVAETAAPRAYAKVLNAAAGLGVDEALAKGIADQSVTFVAESVYCFELGFAPKNVQATVAWIGGGARSFAQGEIGQYVNCPAGSDASVRTTDKDGDGVGNINFFVSFVG